MGTAGVASFSLQNTPCNNKRKEKETNASLSIL